MVVYAAESRLKEFIDNLDNPSIKAKAVEAVKQ